MNPRKPLRRVSQKRQAQLKVYAKRKKVFLEEHPFCFVCWKHKEEMDLHHLRGRAGKLFLDERFWRAVCRACHDTIHKSIGWAMMNGYLATAGQWGVCPP